MVEHELHEKLKNVEEAHIELSKDLEEKHEALKKDISELKKRPAKTRDLWDKLGALTPLISGVLISGIGLYFTHSNNVTQHKIQEVQTIEKLIPHLTGDESEKKMAIIAISTLTNPETAAKIAQMFPSKGTVQALKSIARQGTKKERVAAKKALVSSFKSLGAGMVAHSENDSDAQHYYEQALEVQNDVYGSSSSDTVDTLVKLGYLSEKQKNYEKAISYYDKARQNLIASKRQKTSDFKSVLHSLSRAYRAAGKMGLAKDFGQRAKALGDVNSKSSRKEDSLINPLPAHMKIDLEKDLEAGSSVDDYQQIQDNTGSSEGSASTSTSQSSPVDNTTDKLFPDNKNKSKNSMDSVFSN